MYGPKPQGQGFEESHKKHQEREKARKKSEAIAIYTTSRGKRELAVIFMDLVESGHTLRFNSLRV